MPTIAVPVRNQIRATAHLPYLRGLKLGHSVSEDDILNISLLRGADKYWEIVEDHVIRGDGPTAVQSKIGFLLSGPFTSTSSPPTTDYIMNVVSTSPSSEDIERFWKLESIGIQPLKQEQVSSYLEKYKTNCINFNDARKLMGSAGFNLRSWSSNSSTLRELAEAEAVADSDKFTKILQIIWDPISDNIYLAQKSISTENNMTKRAILQETVKIYDPLGFLCPLTIRAKILLQDIWKQKFDCDTPLPDDIQTQSHKFAVDLNCYLCKSP